VVREETWSYSRLLGLVNAQCIMHKVFQLCDVLRFDSTVFIDLLINISSTSVRRGALWHGPALDPKYKKMYKQYLAVYTKIFNIGE